MRNCYIGFALVLGFFFSSVKAQTVFYNNGLVHVTPNAILHVNGPAEMDGAGASSAVQLHNDGIITVANSSANGDFTISNGGVVQGDGDYLIENDWINNATFTADSSYVNLYGANQQITGTNQTTYWDLELTGSGIKTQTLDAYVSNQLILNNLELATQGFTMFVTNPAPAAVSNDQTYGAEGFVSSTTGGALSRATNSTSTYLFPTGSSAGTTRYRPVEITPDNSTAGTYRARLANNDPTVDGYNKDSVDATICSVNDQYYHMIDRGASSADADIAIYYDNTSETFSGLAQWTTPSANVWNDVTPANTTTGTNYNSIAASSWSDFSQRPWAFTDLRPSAPLVNGPSGFCAGEDSLLFYATGGNGNSYTWNFPSGTSVISGGGTDSVLVSWGDTAGSVSVVANSATGCSSAPSSPFLVSILESPTAYFYTDTNNVFADIPIAFTDTSWGNIVGWSWAYGDGDSSNIQNPYHKFPGPGEYLVELEVENDNGCTDTTTKLITIIEGLKIPNVFSPNGDGTNDVFYFSHSGVTEFSITIFNRWGQQLFSSSSAEISWDGRTSAGVEVPEGTYYYEVQAKSDSKDYGTTTGYVTLIR